MGTKDGPFKKNIKKAILTPKTDFPEKNGKMGGFICIKWAIWQVFIKKSQSITKHRQKHDFLLYKKYCVNYEPPKMNAPLKFAAILWKYSSIWTFSESKLWLHMCSYKVSLVLDYKRNIHNTWYLWPYNKIDQICKYHPKFILCKIG